MPNIQIIPPTPRSQQPSFSNLLAQSLGTGLGQGLNKSVQNFLESKQRSDLQKQLEAAGVPKNLAQVYDRLTEGGKTAAVQKGLEIGERSQVQPQIDTFETESMEFNIPKDTGLTLKERIKREESRYKDNLTQLKDTSKKLEAVRKEERALDQLDKLNRSGKLPKGLGRLNVNPKSGELFWTAGANKETQKFVKIVNDFTTQAKDSYGSRVTNFELQRFLQRLPTLANTQEGRDEILKYMKGSSALSKEYNQTIKDIFKKAGGARKIDLDRVLDIADERVEKKHKKLINELQDFWEESPERPPLESFFK